MTFRDKTSRLTQINKDLESYLSEVEPKNEKIKESISDIEKYEIELA